MGKHDHYIFVDGCVVKGCRSFVDFEHTFGEYAALLEDLYKRGRWGEGEKRLFGFSVGHRSFSNWLDEHVHTAQSTQNLQTGAGRVDEMLRSIKGRPNIHLFGTSAGGSAILEYLLFTDPDTLYYRPRDLRDRLRPARRYSVDSRIASLTIIDSPTNWVPLRHDLSLVQTAWGKGTLGYYLQRHTRVKAGPRFPEDQRTVRVENVPGTLIGGKPVAGLDYDNNPHYGFLPSHPMARHQYTGGHMSRETRRFLERVWK